MKWYLLTQTWASEDCGVGYALIELCPDLIQFIEKARGKHKELQKEIDSLFQMTFLWIGYPYCFNYGHLDDDFEWLMAKATVKDKSNKYPDWALFNESYFPKINFVNLDGESVSLDVNQLVVDTHNFYWKAYLKNSDILVLTRHVPLDKLSDIKKEMKKGLNIH